MSTWRPGPRQSSRLYAPRALLSPALWSEFTREQLTLVDTLAGAAPEEPIHPHELLRRAFHVVQDDREALEIDLAERWCAERADPLLADGGLPRGAAASTSDLCVGVVKSHHTLFTTGQGLKQVFALPEGARTSVFLIERQWGPRVASWYLRLRTPRTNAPLWGLVRAEVAWRPDFEQREAVARRAAEVSRWILAERAPLSLPDARWDAMLYGVRDCESYLRAWLATH
jgi:hypothetical protein